MASILFVVGALVVESTPFEVVPMVGLFVGFSLAVVAVGLLGEWVIRRATGGSLFTVNRNHDER